ncbi:MAG: hypothetical protein QM811_20115 [Pirellulales bacterium]
MILIACIASAGLGALMKLRDTSEAEFLPLSLALLILPSGLLIAIGMVRGGLELFRAWRADRAAWNTHVERVTPGEPTKIEATDDV